MDHRIFVSLAKWPFLALAPRTRPISFRGYEMGRHFTLRVETTDPGLGIATLTDGDLLVFAASVIAHRHPLLTDISRDIEFSPAEALRFLGRSTGGRQRELLRASLARLLATRVEWGVNGAKPQLFSLIESHDVQESRRWSFRLGEFWANELRKKRIAKISQPALQLRGLERRLFYWARAHSGPAQNTFEISLHDAYHKAATTDRFAKFHAAIREIAATRQRNGILFKLEGKKGKEILSLHLYSDDVGLRPPPLGVLDLSDYV